MKQSTFWHWFNHPRWSTSFVIELGAAVALWAMVGAVLLSLNMRDLQASYQFEGFDPVQTSIPFLADTQSDYLNVDMRFSLNPLHARRFVIIPDDCIEALIVNDDVIDEANGLCLRSPGYHLVLNALEPGENTMFVRLKDNGGQGGFSIRVSFLDPLVFTFTLLLILLTLWIAMRAIRVCGGSPEAAALPFIILLGLLLRLSLSGHGGFGGDIHLNQEWARSAVELGIVESYSQQVDPEVMLPNYPPLSIALFQMTGHVFQQFFSPEFDDEAPIFRILIKLPAIIADLLTVIVLFFILSPIAGRRSAVLGSLLYAMQPAVIHDSSVWGQIDSVFTLFLCLTILAMLKNHWILAGAMIAAAILFKMQSIILLPVIAVAAGPDWRRWIKGVTGVAIISIPTLLPFVVSGSMDSISKIYVNSVGYYSGLSSSAYNLWVMLYGRDTGKASTDLLFDFITYRQLGLLLWLIVIACVTIGWSPAIQRDIKLRGKTGVTMFSAALIAYAFFLFNAEMHERYLFPYMALGLPLLLTGGRGIIMYIASSLLFFINLESLVAIGQWDLQLIQVEFLQGHPVAVATAQVIVFFLTWRHLHLYQLSHGGKPLADILQAPFDGLERLVARRRRVR